MQTLGLVDAVVWFVVVEAIAFSVFPLLARAMPSAPDRGFGLSKVFGIFALGLPAWLIPTLFGVPANQLLVTAIFGVLILSGFTQYNTASVRNTVRSLTSQILAGEVLFLGLSLAFLTVRFFNPEIVWGEKPMDSTFLHFFVRNETLPPQDPWASGSPMHYYYLGIYFLALLLKLTGIPVAVGYNLAVATLGGLIGAALYSGALLFLRRPWVSCAAAAFVVLSCNPEVLFLSLGKLQLPTFDNTFWASSRVFVSPGFFEYTLWSLLFADLHAHVVAIPFTALVLVIAIYVSLHPEERYSSHGFLSRVVLGLALGALFGLNTWDFISYGAPTAALLALAPVPRFWKPPSRPDGTVSLRERAFATLFARVVATVWDFGVVGLCARAVSWLFQRETLGRPSAGWGWVTETEFNSLYQVFQALGVWMVLGLSILVAMVWCRWRSAKPLKLVGSGFVAALCAVLALTPAIESKLHGIAGQSSALLGYVAFFVFVAYIAVVSLWRERFSKALFILLAYPLVLVLILEHFYLMDRMNTLFKGYMAVWLISGFSAVVVAAWYGLSVWKEGTRRTRLLYGAFVSAIAGLGLLGTAMDTRAVLNMQRVPERTYTLDGASYLRSMNAEDYDIVQWFNRNVAGTPVLVEAQGASYQNYTRISMHTGIPVVLGWEYHVQQRGLPSEELAKRKQMVHDLYTTSDASYAEAIVDEYGIDFVVVGAQEREAYGSGVLARLRRMPALYQRAASFGSSTIFVTTRSSYRDLAQPEGR